MAELEAVPDVIVPPEIVHWNTLPGVAATVYVCDELAATMPGRRVVGLPKPVDDCGFGDGIGLTITVVDVVAEQTPPTAVSVTDTVAVPVLIQRRLTWFEPEATPSGTPPITEHIVEGLTFHV